MPNLYVIGGAKTTVSLSLLPTFVGVFEYVNADAISAGLFPQSKGNGHAVWAVNGKAN
ncbi:hypothetical protein [Acaryochloris sp. IP29b_bin.137]|uniref:hypothetical protein n=1 Tax=Acaryochloris sp. IP29b_bin.137 TaxID=2969217 RepID=UPI00262C636A|nr:hypothetical protein [Acaryochloris sp. IP29b_bin.137]